MSYDERHYVWLVVSIIGAILAVFSTCVMSYLTMATPIGPWIAPTLALMAMLLFKIFRYKKDRAVHASVLATCAGSVGGIVATAFGFSFPTLYFVDKAVFMDWLSSPIYFSCVLSAFALAAGGFGFWIAGLLEQKFIYRDKLAFPISMLVHKMIAAQQNIRKAYELTIGFVGSLLFSIFQDGCFIIKGCIPKSCVLISQYSYGVFRMPTLVLDVWPMMWAIGIVTGHVIAMPLAVGALVKILVADPLHAAYFIARVSPEEFMLAFCSGLVVSSAVIGAIDIPKLLWRSIKNRGKKCLEAQDRPQKSWYRLSGFCMETVAVFAVIITFLTYFRFSIITQVYLVGFAFICAYQIARISGEIGMAQLGRFATFVMVPAIFIFSLTKTQIVIIASFVEICGGVAADILFGRKMSELAHIDSKQIKRYQFWGLVVSALVIGIVFSVLFHTFQIGSPELFCQRAQARALLIGVKTFDFSVLLIGFVFGFFLKWIRMNPLLVLGGIIMPLNLSLALIIGGFAGLLFKNKEEWIPFWSGVFAAGSLWALFRAFVGC